MTGGQAAQCIYVLVGGTQRFHFGNPPICLTVERELPCAQRTSLSEIPSANTHYRNTRTSPTGTENVTGHTITVMKLLHNQRDR